MLKLQKYFEEFHNTIKLTDENQELREKRGIILDKLSEKKAEDVPTYTTFNQGSYAMHTGVKPLEGEYDIDVAICFEISKDDYTDPVEVKKWVYDALEGHTKSVRVKTPCVTVTYQKDKEPAFHVDLAIYAGKTDDGKMYLAKGKLNSNDENKFWEVSNPKELIKLISEKFTDTNDRSQFRRVIRYLKRWKDIKFSSEGNAAPIGIGITVAAYEFFEVNKQYDGTANKYCYNDFDALKNFIETLLGKFVTSVVEGETISRLEVKLPVEPNKDLFEKMTDKQMENFKVKLEEMLEVLESVEDEVDTHEACKELQKDVFGSDFPVPAKEKTGQAKKMAITTSSESA